MSNSGLNRTLVALLTNTSGSGVAKGDVVILDPSAALSFKATQTPAQTLYNVGVVLDPSGISAGAKGAVALGGYIPKINLNSSAGIGNFLRTSDQWFRGDPFASSGSGDFGVALTSGSSPEAFLFTEVRTSVGGGEANTASNVGTAGVGIFDAKVGVDLQFRKLNPLSQKISIALDAANKKVDFDVVTGTSGSTVTVGNDPRLSDARTPLAHASTHTSGGSDQVSAQFSSANNIPRAGPGGKLDAGWISQVLASTDLTNDSALEHVVNKKAALGYASLDSGSLVEQNPKIATVTPTAGSIPIAGAGGKLAAGWMSGVLASSDLTNDAALEKVANKKITLGYPSLDANVLVEQNPKIATTTPTAGSIPISLGTGKLAAGWISGVLASSDLTDGSGLEKTINKGASSGYAPLTSGSLVPTNNLGTGVADTSKFLRGDSSWQAPPGVTPSDTVTSETSFGLSPAAGSSALYSRGDHTHGTPSDSTLEKIANKGTASGYAGLDAGTKVPTAQLGGAGADATKYLRGDQSWATPTGGSAPTLSISTVAINFLDGDTLRRVRVTDANVLSTSKITAAIRRPYSTTGASDKSFLYLPNIVNVIAGAFDVEIACMDYGYDDPFYDPPFETINLDYILG